MTEQAAYQVRFDWGVPGAAAVAGDVDVLVWVDAVDATTGPELATLPTACAVGATGFDGAEAAAAWVLEVQEGRRARTSVAVIAAGAVREGGRRWAAEDLLAAGAVLDALEARGIDAMSPEAAVATAAFQSLRAGARSMVPVFVGGGGTPAGPFQVLRHP